MDLGALIRHKRMELGWSQAHLARIADITQPLVSRVESGKRPADIYIIRRLGEAVGIDPRELIAYADDICDDVERAIVRSGLSQEKRVLMLTIYGQLSKRNSVESGQILSLLDLSQKVNANDVQDDV
jgi:transcriptional regulator with XRE-family HTH domain